MLVFGGGGFLFVFSLIAACVHLPCSWIVDFESEDGVEEGCLVMCD